MRISPRYCEPAILSIPGDVDAALRPTVRQRRRMETMLGELSDAQWAVQSRCAEWSVRDVVAHLVGVNAFWAASIQGGMAGDPTRMLGGFDPANTPLLMVTSMSSLSHQEVLAQFIASNDTLVELISSLTADDWNKPAEAPPGHISISAVAMHALWDAWVHERDIAIPLNVACPTEDDEVALCLRYVATLSPALAVQFGLSSIGSFAVQGSAPDMSFHLVISDDVGLFDGLDQARTAPCLRGNSVHLIEALSLRVDLDEDAPAAWRKLLVGLATAFDSAQPA